jgi:predicted dinucleotide-utilizing enzyme
MSSGKPVRRVGVIGFGKVGQFLVSKILEDTSGTMELAFVVDLFNPEGVMKSEIIPAAAKAESLAGYKSFNADVIAEVAHPDVSKDHGAMFINDGCDYLSASTTAFANPDVEASVYGAANSEANSCGLYLAQGALWGAPDIQRMAESGKLAKLTVTMKKHPESLFPVRPSPEYDANEEAKGKQEECILYDGPTRPLAATFPVNVNTICTAAIAANSSIGFDTRAILIADARLEEMQIIVKAEGPPMPDGSPGVRITTVRENPSKKGEVTGHATLLSFFSSLRRLCGAASLGKGVHLI